MINVGIIYGSKSVEHEISILTGYQIFKGLDKNKYTCFNIYVSKNLDFYLLDNKISLEEFKNLNEVEKKGERIDFVKKGIKVKNRFHRLDIALLCLHGTYGEDGAFSSLLDILEIPYVGSSRGSAVISQDKVFFKQILKDNNVTVVPHKWLYDVDYEENISLEEYPVIVKPAHLGSSIGIKVCQNDEELNKAIQEAFLFDNKVLLESYVEGFREINCAVLGDYSYQEVSNLEEVFKQKDYLSYQDKYLTKVEDRLRIIPAVLDEEKEREVKEIAKKVFKIIGASGVARIDFLLKDDLCYVNEINTIPGSLSYYLWDYKLDELLDRLIYLGFSSFMKKNNYIYSLKENILDIRGIKK